MMPTCAAGATPSHRTVRAETMPVCLIQPVADDDAAITDEELMAKVTWGVREVKATGTNLTGAGVKVSTQHLGCNF